MNSDLKAAWAKRDTPEMQSMRKHFVETIEKRLREVATDVPSVERASRCFIDCAALYAGQAGLSKESFLTYAAESYEMYKFLSNGFPNGDYGAVAAKLRFMMSK